MIKRYFLFSFLFLCSCRVGDNYSINPPLDNTAVQEELSIHESSNQISKNWYSIFNDEDLNTLLTFALQDNFTVKQGIERLQQARYNYLINSKQTFPNLDYSLDYTFQKTDNPSFDIENTNLFKTGFDVAWEMDIWGKGQYISDHYFELVKKAKYSLLNIQVSITSEIISQYISLREAQEKLHITQKNLNLQKEIYQIILNKHESGTADDLALNQAKNTIEQTLSQIPPIKIQIENKKNQIAVLVGKSPKQLPINLDKYKNNIVSKTFKYSVKNLYNLPLDVVRLRPDVSEAEKAVQAQNSQVNEAITSLYPTLNLSATFGYFSSSGRSLFNSDNQIYSYSPTLITPIWHWKQLVNNIELQKHIRNEYLQNYNEVFLSALIEIKNAIIGIEQAYKANSHYRNSFYHTQNIMTLTEDKYINGLVDFTDLAQAEQTLLNAQISVAESNATILQNIISFYKATGGGYYCNK